MIKTLRAAVADAFKRPRHIRVPVQFTNIINAPFWMQMDRLTCLRHRNSLQAFGNARHHFTRQKIMNVAGGRHAVVGHARGWCQQNAPGFGAETAVDFRKASDSPRCQDRGVTQFAPKIIEERIPGHFSPTLACRRPHVRCDLGAGGGVKIDHAVFASFLIVELKRSHAAQAAHKWIDNHLRKCGSNGGVESVAAGFQNLHAHISRARLRTYDNALHNRSPVWLFRGGVFFRPCVLVHFLTIEGQIGGVL